MVTFGANTPGAEVAKAYASEIKGKTVVITGPSDGTIGGLTAIDIASSSPKTIILAGRTLSKIQPVIDTIKSSGSPAQVTFVTLDLTDLASVRKAAEEISSKVDKIDVLINNAGVMAVKDYTQTKDGFELQFGANHVGHFLLTNLLVPKIEAAHGRVINLTSFGYMSNGVRLDDPHFSNGSTYNPWVAYAQSKTANILFSKSLATKLSSKHINAYAVHPGLVMDTKLMTNVTPEMFGEGKEIAMKSLGNTPMPSAALTPKPFIASDSTTLYGAFSPDIEDKSGAFLADSEVFTELPLLPHATSDSDAKQLWTLSEQLVGQKFDY